MIKLISALLLLALLISSCGTDSENDFGNENIIPQDIFTEILAECQLAESQLTVTRVLQPLYKDSIHNYYVGIFDAYDVTAKEFNISLKHYTKDPSNMDSIYSNVINILNEKSDILGDVEIPKNDLNAISRTQLGDILYKTPFAERILSDSTFKILKIRDSLMSYIDSNVYLLDSVNVNRASFEFSFIINTSSKIMSIQLKDYMLSIKNKSTK